MIQLNPQSDFAKKAFAALAGIAMEINEPSLFRGMELLKCGAAISLKTEHMEFVKMVISKKPPEIESEKETVVWLQLAAAGIDADTMRLALMLFGFPDSHRVALIQNFYIS